MEEQTMIGYALATAICIGLGAGIAMANIYPCGYWDSQLLYEKGGFAGHGHHSLSHVLGEGFFWHADSVPVENPKYEGDGPYFAVGNWMISLLYIPVFLALMYFWHCAAWYIAERMRKRVPA